MSTTQEIETQLKALQLDYADKLPGKIREAQQQWTLVRQDPTDIDAIRRLRQIVHGLAGGAASFGIPGISAAARPLAERLQDVLNSGRLPDPAQVERWQSAMEDIARAAELTGDGGGPRLEPPPVLVPAASPCERRLLYLVEDDVVLARNLALQISCYGYVVRIFNDPAMLPDAVRKDPPAAILMDIIFPEGGLAGTEAIRDLREHGARHVPVIFFSVRDDLMARLQAVRAGGDAYFTKPVDINEIGDALDRLTATQETEPCRILLVEDDPGQVAWITLTLRQAGMQTAVVVDPFQVIQPLVEFRPDLILMDIHMPGCNGIELARVIRQQEAYVGIPIVFLTADGDLRRRHDAMRTGGDEYLTKPVRGEDLVEIVRARVARARVLRSYMIQDSLTGLLNHTHIKEHLEREVARARRHGQSLAFGLLDIDYFKSVNDTYGHTAGDRVVRNFARLLRQRLRKSDLIGRYGGDEFAVILPGAVLADAVKVLEQIRAGFSSVRQRSFHEEFGVTVSGGVSVMGPSTDARLLCEAADRALYRAKQEGRNRVVAG
jgi:diguanylate cyclase (GGDEF)-like protein